MNADKTLKVDEMQLKNNQIDRNVLNMIYIYKNGIAEE